MSSSPVFYGWWVTVAFSVMVFVSAGVRHAVGPFLKPMVADLGVDRGAFSLVIALGLFLYGAFMPWIGGLTDRFGARRVTAAGSVLLGASLALTAYCQNLWHLALVYGVLASLGLACTGPVVANAVVTRWFVRRRGTAVSFTTDIYGRYSVGSILGVIFLVHQTGAALGSWLAGALFEATGGYGAMFAIACVLLAAAGLVSRRVEREPRMLRWATRAAGA